MSVVVELYGGPLDGLAVDLDAPVWSPPLTLRFPIAARPVSVLDAATSAPLEVPPVPSHAYDRRPSPLEDGPVWRYVYRVPE